MILDTLRAKLFFSAPQRCLFEKAIPAFTYHHVAVPSSAVRDPFLFVAPREFSKQISKLARAGYTTGRLTDVMATRGNPERKIVISFDDGYRNVFQNALPTLVKHRYTAMQFLVSGLIGKRNEWDVHVGETPQPLMDDLEVKEWIAAGQVIGSHSRTHCNLRNVSPAVARAEIFDSKKELEDRFGVEVTCFCFPYGALNESLCDLVQEAGYKAAASVRFGVNLPGSSAYALSRIEAVSFSSFLKKGWHRLRR